MALVSSHLPHPIGCDRSMPGRARTSERHLGETGDTGESRRRSVAASRRTRPLTRSISNHFTPCRSADRRSMLDRPQSASRSARGPALDGKATGIGAPDQDRPAGHRQIEGLLNQIEGLLSRISQMLFEPVEDQLYSRHPMFGSTRARQLMRLAGKTDHLGLLAQQA